MENPGLSDSQMNTHGHQTDGSSSTLCLSFGYKQNRWQKSGYCKETTIQLILLLNYLFLFGVIFAVPSLLQGSQNQLLLMMGLHLGHLAVLILARLRSTFWCAQLLERGYLHFPRRVNTSRKAPLAIFLVSSNLLNILLAWTRYGCGSEDDEPCVLSLTEHQILEIALGLEVLLVALAWLIYILQVVCILRRVQLPDVAQKLWKEREFLNPAESTGPVASVAASSSVGPQPAVADLLHGEWVGAILSISETGPPSHNGNATPSVEKNSSTSSTRLLPNTDEMTDPGLYETQGAMLRYLQHRNDLLSKKVAQLTRALEEAKGTSAASRGRVGLSHSMGTALN